MAVRLGGRLAFGRTGGLVGQDPRWCPGREQGSDVHLFVTGPMGQWALTFQKARPPSAETTPRPVFPLASRPTEASGKDRPLVRQLRGGRREGAERSKQGGNRPRCRGPSPRRTSRPLRSSPGPCQTPLDRADRPAAAPASRLLVREALEIEQSTIGEGYCPGKPAQLLGPASGPEL